MGRQRHWKLWNSPPKKPGTVVHLSKVIMTWDWPLAYARTPMLHESDPVQGAQKEFEASVAGLERAYPELTITTSFVHGDTRPPPWLRPPRAPTYSLWAAADMGASSECSSAL